MGAAASFGDSSGSQAVGEDQAQLGVERVDAVLAGRGVDAGAQVGDRRVVLEGADRVAQPLATGRPRDGRTVSSSTLSHWPKVGEPVRMSTTTSRNDPATAVTYLACEGGTSAKWMPRTVPREETEVLVCSTPQPVPDVLGQVVGAEGLQEHPTVVAELARA